MDLNTVLAVTGLVGALASLLQIFKQLYTVIDSVNQIKHDIRACDVQVQADLTILKQAYMSQKEEFSRQLEQFDQRLDAVENTLAKYFTLRRE